MTRICIVDKDIGAILRGACADLLRSEQNAGSFNSRTASRTRSLLATAGCPPITPRGYSTKNGALVLLDHPFVDNGKTRTAGHISDELEHELEKICKEYSGNVTLEWNSYCIPWMRQALKQGLNALGFGIKYHDVNQKAEKLSTSLSEQGYNVPIVADTDLHARSELPRAEARGVLMRPRN